MIDDLASRGLNQRHQGENPALWTTWLLTINLFVSEKTIKTPLSKIFYEHFDRCFFFVTDIIIRKYNQTLLKKKTTFKNNLCTKNIPHFNRLYETAKIFKLLILGT